MTNEVLTTLGVFCILAAIVGGGVKALGFELQALSSLVRQSILGIFGGSLILLGNSGALIPDKNPPPMPKPVVPADQDSPARDSAKTAPLRPPSAPDPKPKPEAKAPTPPTIPATDTALNLTGYLCAINSYGTEEASKWREQTIIKLKSLGCSFDETQYLAQDCRPSYHLNYEDGPAWSAFSATNSVIYYSPSNLTLAQKTANLLGKNFTSFQGGGQCIKSAGRSRLLMIHYRDR